MNQPRKLAVVGHGIIGLTTSIRLLQQGHAVDIFSRDPFSQTTSMAAGAYWWPHKAYPQHRVAQWARTTLKEYLVATHNAIPGIFLQEHLRFCIAPDDSSYALEILENWQEIDGALHGIMCDNAYRMELPVIDVPIYMNYLRNLAISAGAHTYIKQINSLITQFGDYDLVVNCSGLGARELALDDLMFPIRGQIVRVSLQKRQSHSTRLIQNADHFTLVLPRTNDCILGGTAQVGDWSLDIRENEIHQILNRCAKLNPEFGNCQILGASVGLRPGREEVRLELELSNDSLPIIHNYGHGGGGFTTCWGCAEDVVRIVASYFDGA